MKKFGVEYRDWNKNLWKIMGGLMDVGIVMKVKWMRYEDSLEQDVVYRLLLFTSRAFNEDILITADVNNCAEDSIMRTHFGILEYLTTAS